MPNTNSGRNMGFDFGLSNPLSCFKRKNRWLFSIPGVSADGSSIGVNSLPPLKSARPNISFKEIEIQHITETIFFPGKPDFKPITVTLYDLKKNINPVFQWITALYNPNAATISTNSSNTTATYKPSCDENQFGVQFKIPYAALYLYDGCGNVIESWIFEGVWPQTIEFGDLDMTSSEVVTCDLTLRYDRAYIDYSNQ